MRYVGRRIDLQTVVAEALVRSVPVEDRVPVANPPAPRAAQVSDRPVAQPLTPNERRLYQGTTASTPAAAKDRLFETALRKWRERDLAGAHALLEHAHELCPDDLAVKATLDVVQRKLKAT